ncbi:hypothetical protein ARMGADRAFT_1036564 [Armillaria gallica]|uniref:Uncharacterized protein n=1 Tax=Armillaria gallica TaxID=47427 RepID=A0A2H3D3C3_ARMGA|nr:hypothetical protein ARMGADRAFT_1036564 [Armillaria gallica]
MTHVPPPWMMGGMKREAVESKVLMVTMHRRAMITSTQPGGQMTDSEIEVDGGLMETLNLILNFGGSNTLADFDPVLALRSSTANPASNPARFLDVFSVSFTFGFGFGVLVQKSYVFRVENQLSGFGYQIPKAKSSLKGKKDFTWYFRNKPHI